METIIYELDAVFGWSVGSSVIGEGKRPVEL